MPHRDPETGRFVSSESLDQFDRIVPLHVDQDITVSAADLDGTTGEGYGERDSFEGVDLFDYEEMLDRDEVGVILWARHEMVPVLPSTQTADGTLHAATEWSLSPARKVVAPTGNSLNEPIADQSGTDFTMALQSADRFSTTSDILGAILEGVAYAPITDGTNGVGGAGSSVKGEWEGPLISAPVVDDRDNLFLNGIMEVSNVSDGSVAVHVQGYHEVGVMEA